MQCAYVTQHLGAGKVLEALKLGQLPVPELKPNEVLVRVKASTINIDDIHMAQGTFAGGLSVVQTRTPTEKAPVVVGSDFAGVVEEVGSKVVDVKVGSRVCGLQQQPFGHMGSWSTLTVTPRGNLVVIPETCSFEQAAALVMPLFVSLAILRRASVKDNQRVLVIGASGGIGSVCTQLLRAKGKIHLVAVCSGKNSEFVKQLGANAVVDYTKGKPEDQLKDEPKFDVVVDLLGGPDSYRTGRILLKPHTGIFITSTGPIAWLGETKLGCMDYCSASGTILRHMIANGIPGTHPYYYLVVPTKLEKDAIEKALANGVAAQISDTIKLEKEALEEAISTVQQHRVRGKIVISIG